MRVDPIGKLLLGLGTGVAFGALLEKGGVARHDMIVRQLLLHDGRVATVMGTAAAVGAVGVYALERAGKTQLSVKPLQPVAIVGGGVLFGAGVALLGYCPGTSLAAVGAGRRDAVAGVLGMLAGAVVFTWLYPRFKAQLEAGNQGKVTLPEVTRTPRWPWIAGLSALIAGRAALEARP
ncbi:MAG: YeeE/YedE thiosulfate transporter family protein [Deltaproteobacteria bacterium]|nr:YeeE/YedE thiosulfate transporter family protein [Myxococcales bacterium]MDP3217231.1 YeeE/YedE thiosulfate transporter family protein [Deltaproteobacteria bacterium]